MLRKLRHVADGITCPPKKGVVLIFIALKIHRYCRVWTFEPSVK
jgi:hypothetical protein